jgi:hypothetical protein
MSKLTKIAEAELGGQRYDIARNGEHCHLVVEDGEDAYGKPIHRRVALEKAVPEGLLQALLDAYGEALVALRSAKDMNLKRGPE